MGLNFFLLHMKTVNFFLFTLINSYQELCSTPKDTTTLSLWLNKNSHKEPNEKFCFVLLQISVQNFIRPLNFLIQCLFNSIDIMALTFDMIGNGYRRCGTDAKWIFAILLNHCWWLCWLWICYCRRICYCFGLFPNNGRFGFLKIIFGYGREFLAASCTPAKTRKYAVLELKLSIKVFATRTHARLHKRLFKIVTKRERERKWKIEEIYS